MSAKRSGLAHITDVAQTLRLLLSMTKAAPDAPDLATIAAHGMDMFSNIGGRRWPNAHAMGRADSND